MMCGEIADFHLFFVPCGEESDDCGGRSRYLGRPGGKVGDRRGRTVPWIMLLSLHGQSKDALAKTKAGAWEYDIAAPLYKCNMTDIMAAIGLVQLKRYRGNF